MTARTVLASAAALTAFAATAVKAQTVDPTDQPFARLSESRPAAIEANWTAVKLPNGRRIGLLGLHYLMAVDEAWGFGPSFYGAAKGDHGGIFTVGLTGQRRWRLGQNTHVAAGLYAGAGGGLSSAQLRFGGGLMLRPELSLRTEFGDWYAGAGIAHVRFPSGNVSGTSYSLSLGKASSFASFAPADAGRLGRASTRTGLGFDEVVPMAGFYKPSARTRNRSGEPSTARMSSAGAELRQYIADGSWWSVAAAGAAQGGSDGYMEVMGKAGQDWAIGHPSLRLGAELGLGLGGGGNVHTGSGWLLRAGPTLRWQTPWGPSVQVNAGLTHATGGQFTARHLQVGLGMPLDQTPAFYTGGTLSDKAGGTVRTQQVFTSVQHLPRVRFKDGSRESIGNIVIVMTRELSNSVYGTAQAGSAAFGKAGAYSIGLVGMGLQSPLMAGRTRVGVEALAGAAGGGGVVVGGGAVGQAEAWAAWEWERLRLRAGIGQWRSLRNSEQSSALVNLSIGYAFGTLSR